jgi:hypothetical protein
VHDRRRLLPGVLRLGHRRPGELLGAGLERLGRPGRPLLRVVTAPDTDAHQREVGRFVAYGALWPVRLASTPLAHGLGEAAWTNMVRRTRTTINRSLEFNLDRDVDGTNPCPEDFREKLRQFPKGTGAFARFFETLLHYYYRTGS